MQCHTAEPLVQATPDYALRLTLLQVSGGLTQSVRQSNEQSAKALVPFFCAFLACPAFIVLHEWGILWPEEVLGGAQKCTFAETRFDVQRKNSRCAAFFVTIRSFAWILWPSRVLGSARPARTPLDWV